MHMTVKCQDIRVKVYSDIKNNKQVKQQFTQELLKIRITLTYNSNIGGQKKWNNALKAA